MGIQQIVVLGLAVGTVPFVRSLATGAESRWGVERQRVPLTQATPEGNARRWEERRCFVKFEEEITFITGGVTRLALPSQDRPLDAPTTVHYAEPSSQIRISFPARPGTRILAGPNGAVGMAKQWCVYWTRHGDVSRDEGASPFVVPANGAMVLDGNTAWVHWRAESRGDQQQFVDGIKSWVFMRPGALP